MPVWNDIAGLARGASLVGRAFLREQSRILDQRWQTGSGKEGVLTAVRTCQKVLDEARNPEAVKDRLKETVERAQTFAEGVRQGATAVFSRSVNIPVNQQRMPPENITQQSTFYATPPDQKEELLDNIRLGSDAEIKQEELTDRRDHPRKQLDITDKENTDASVVPERERKEELFDNIRLGGEFEIRQEDIMDGKGENRKQLGTTDKENADASTVPQREQKEELFDNIRLGGEFEIRQEDLMDRNGQRRKQLETMDQKIAPASTVPQSEQKEEVLDNIRLGSDYEIKQQEIVDRKGGIGKQEETGNKKDNLLKATAAIIDQQLSETARERRVPSSRMARAASFASKSKYVVVVSYFKFESFLDLMAGLAAGAVTELTKKSLGLSQKESQLGLLDQNPILSEANAERIVNTLCRVRGAALKLGQMLSIQDNTLISPQVQRIFERVRYSADFMPKWQVEKTMKAELGPDWRTKFVTFNDRPFAAASIGQVHKGTLPDGMEVAVKIQYPGVAKSIDSDINNLVMVLTVGNILPRGMYLDSMVRVSKIELAQECDYLREAASMKRFKNLLAGEAAFYVPEVVDELTTKQILCAELIHGLPVDKCVDLDQGTRNWIGTRLLDLCLRELFEFNFMQTDPNWSNFFYNSEKRQLILLDFGASREFEKPFVRKYMDVIKAAAEKNQEKILQHSKQIGFLVGLESKVMQQAHCDAVSILGEPFSMDGEFDFGTQNTTARVQRLIPIMLEHRLTPPPEEIYSLHRKLAGTFLLCAKLKSRIKCRPLFVNACSKFS